MKHRSKKAAAPVLAGTCEKLCPSAADPLAIFASHHTWLNREFEKIRQKKLTAAARRRLIEIRARNRQLGADVDRCLES